MMHAAEQEGLNGIQYHFVSKYFFTHAEDPYLDTIMDIVRADMPDSAEQIGHVFDAIHHVNHVRGRRAAV